METSGDDIFQEVLRICDLEDVKDKLKDELGVTKCAQVEYLKDDDLKGIGLTVAQMRQLQLRAKHAECPDDDDHESDAGTPFSSCGKQSLTAFHEDYDKVFQALRRQKTRDSSSFAKGSGSLGSGPELSFLARTESETRRMNSPFWQKQARGRPKRLIFVRHGESEANVERALTKYVPDHALHLTDSGRDQALAAGLRLKELLEEESVKFIVSPYVRTRETCNGILNAWGGCEPEQWTSKVSVQTDVRIREMEMGNFDADNIEEMHAERGEFGKFYYRFRDGESAADCYDRASLFIESMYRSWEDNEYANQVIVGHGMMTIVLLMRLCRLDISEYDTFAKLENTEIICMERVSSVDGKFNVSFAWPPGKDKHLKGIRRKDAPKFQIWDGTLGAPALKAELRKSKTMETEQAIM